MENQFRIESLGTCKIPSPLPLSKPDDANNFRFASDEAKILFDIHQDLAKKETSGAAFEQAGPRELIYFDPSKTKAGIVTCGGLCPGINNVIRNIVMQMYYMYKVKQIYGFRFGYQGFIPSYGHQIMELHPGNVKDIHAQGGSILSCSRGSQDIGEIVDCLDRKNINILFCIGGDGTLKGAMAIAEEVIRRGLKISVIGVPKTIDNDILYCSKSFGFETAIGEAVNSIRSAHVEANGYPYGIVMVKLMGRDSGFIAANTVLANPDVNYVLVPEVPFELEGENGFLPVLERGLAKKQKQGQHPHAVIVVAEGAGQHLFQSAGVKDISGNVKHNDIGIFLKEKISAYFKNHQFKINLKYIEPSYIIRSIPANANDATFCYRLADHAVHAGMAGKTNMMVGYWNDEFTHVPLKEVTKGRKKIDTSSELWRQVLFATGQPKEMK